MQNSLIIIPRYTWQSLAVSTLRYLHRVNMIDTVNTHANHTSFDCLVKSDKGAIHMQLNDCDSQPWVRLFATRCTLQSAGCWQTQANCIVHYIASKHASHIGLPRPIQQQHRTSQRNNCDRMPCVRVIATLCTMQPSCF